MWCVELDGPKAYDLTGQKCQRVFGVDNLADGEWCPSLSSLVQRPRGEVPLAQSVHLAVGVCLLQSCARHESVCLPTSALGCILLTEGFVCLVKDMFRH